MFFEKNKWAILKVAIANLAVSAIHVISEYELKLFFNVNLDISSIQRIMLCKSELQNVGPLY